MELCLGTYVYQWIPVGSMIRSAQPEPDSFPTFISPTVFPSSVSILHSALFALYLTRSLCKLKRSPCGANRLYWRGLNPLNLCHKWVMRRTHMPLQIYLKTTPIQDYQDRSYSDYINVIILCPYHEPLVAQVAQRSGCSNTFGRIE